VRRRCEALKVTGGGVRVRSSFEVNAPVPDRVAWKHSSGSSAAHTLTMENPSSTASAPDLGVVCARGDSDSDSDSAVWMD
jgi:hypothetical protein